MGTVDLFGISSAYIYVFCGIVVIIAFIAIKALPKRKTESGSKGPKNLQQYINAVNEMINRYNNLRSVYPLVSEEKRELILKCEDTDSLERLADRMDNFDRAAAGAGSGIEEIKDMLHDGKVPMDLYHSLEDDITFMEQYLKEIKDIEPVKTEHDWDAGTDSASKETGKEDAAASYFSGCATEGELTKRYRALCKVFHPDSTTGDTGTFRNLQDAYERMKKEMGRT